MIKRPNFAIYGPRGDVTTLYCKVCGAKIAGTEMRPSGPIPSAPLVPKFTRYNNYAETKIRLSDGSFHVTNGCRDCIDRNITASTLYEMYLADMQEMKLPLNLAIRVADVDKVDYSQQGIE